MSSPTTQANAHCRVSDLMFAERSFSLHDVGVELDGFETDGVPSSVKRAVLFHSTPLSQASDEQSTYMREKLGIKTVLDTAPATDFKLERYLVSHVLGITHCRVQLRGSAFAQDLLNEQTPWKLASFKLRADLVVFRPHTRRELVKEAGEMAMKRNVVDEGIAIFKAASKCGLVKYIFNELLATDTGAFPLLVSGDINTRESLNILFLLLVMLGLDGDAIKRVISRFEGTSESTCAFVELLKKRFDAELGGKEQFFQGAGVTKQAEITICKNLLNSATKTKEEIESLLD